MNIDRLTIHDSAAALPPYASTSNFDFGSALRVLRRRARLVFWITAFCLAGGLLASLLLANRYESGTSVLLEAPSLNPFGRDQVYGGTKFDNVTIESQMQVIRSPMLLSEVVETLDLDNRAIFWDADKSALAQSLDSAKASVLGLFGSITGTPEAELPSDAERFRDAVDKLRDDVSVTRNGVTSVLSIKVIANSPDLAAEIANTVAQAYVMQRYDMRVTSAETAAGWFETRMEELSQQAADAESQLSAASGLGTAPTANAGQRADAVASLREAISARIEAQTRFDQTSLAMRSQAPLGVLPAQSGDAAFAELSQAYAETMDAAERAALNARAANMLPALLADAQAALDDTTQAEAQARSGMTDVASDDRSAQSDLGRLESEARIYRDMYETYTTTYLRTKEQQTFPVVDASVLGLAQPPEGTTGRSGTQLLLISALLGLTIGAGTAFARENNDVRLRTRASLSRAVGGPVLGLLPPLHRRTALEGPMASDRLPEIGILKPRVGDEPEASQPGTNVVPLPKHRLALAKLRGQMSMTLTQPLSPYSETVRRIRVAFDNHFAPRHNKRGAVIGFVSDTGAEARSTVAMNYAEMTAVGGLKTLLIDFDWLEAFLSRSITPAAGFGMTDLMYSMSPNFTAEDVYWVDERSGLYFLPNRAVGKKEPVDPATFDTALLTKLIAALTRDFDQIVIDFPSLGESVDAAALSAVVDGFVCAAEWGISDRKALARHFAASGIPPEKVVGAVMAGVTEKDIARYESAS
ncbi:Wzz/FepE/Etk N-terminal domain-containing protein [Maritimibacter sp. DP1N21-5]|uniref:Wzz/FepE/Etk N-terminal domain-containing protein n=1 Tax=Maritimibacter sp. DP1N21-5 TaxID=2836867 RepID=UPI001C473682|nr:Wzz/FepE/Etk N-terminal domain-containing protein [Maritimibacter sp. DP1N21-5]MBV7410321.1 hypothetical protein [Maritimibacter sp. DP1N21-5]